MDETHELTEYTQVDDEIAEMKIRIKEMEEEAEKLREMTAQSDKDMNLDGKNESDERSVYVGNVDYSSTPEEIQAHFQSCGTINRGLLLLFYSSGKPTFSFLIQVTILVDKFTGAPKGYAYVEFADSSLIPNAVLLNDSTFKGRQIKVIAKRTNLPSFMMRGRGRGRARGRGRSRARGFRGGFRGRGGYYPY